MSAKVKSKKRKRPITEIEVDLIDSVNEEAGQDMFVGWKPCKGADCTKLVKNSNRCKACKRILNRGLGRTAKFGGDRRSNHGSFSE